MHIKKMDLNLLTVAAALYRYQNVSRAAQSLGLTQSALSHALARLRDALGDPLFVRASRGMVLTDYAKKIRAQVLAIAEQSESLLNETKAFDPKTAKGRITIGTSDYFEILTMPTLLPILYREAPHVQVSIRPMVGVFPKTALEEGELDFVVAGYFSQPPENFYQLKLFNDTFSCGYRKDHPRLGKTISMDQYFNERHALITLQGDFADDTEHPTRKKLKRVYSYGSHSFTGIAWPLTAGDLILTAPTRLLYAFQEFFPIRVVPSPIDHGQLEMKLYGHERTRRDPLKSWFRELLRNFFKGGR